MRRGCEAQITLQKRPFEGNYDSRRRTVVSSDAVWRVKVGPGQTLQVLIVDNLLQQRLIIHGLSVQLFD